jgi:uncharacterized SAM-binding protein YcdF (DUF218 family)
LSITYIDPIVPSLLLTFTLSLWAGWRRLGRLRWLLAAGCLGFFLCSWTPFYHLCLLSLESGYAADTAYPPDRDFDAIVVLAAGAIPPTPWGPDGVIGPGTYVRCQHAAWLYKNVKAVPIITSGGALGGGLRPVSYAEMMRSLLIEQGVPAADIWLEPDSRNTYENTLYSARILREHGIQKAALVTEAYHMPRATLCLRKQGVTVVPAPTGFLTPVTYQWTDFIPRTGALSVMDIVVHEWVGLSWYWLSGKM